MSNRIDIVTNGAADPRLVRASTPAQAIRHVVRPLYKARFAEQDDLLVELSRGTKVEDAREDEAE